MCVSGLNKIEKMIAIGAAVFGLLGGGGSLVYNFGFKNAEIVKLQESMLELEKNLYKEEAERKAEDKAQSEELAKIRHEHMMTTRQISKDLSGILNKVTTTSVNTSHIQKGMNEVNRRLKSLEKKVFRF